MMQTDTHLLWSAVTCHRFGRAGLLARTPALRVMRGGGATSHAVKSGDKSPHSIKMRAHIVTVLFFCAFAGVVPAQVITFPGVPAEPAPVVHLPVARAPAQGETQAQVQPGTLAQSLPQVRARLDLAWPTPNGAFMEGRGIEAFIQPTVSGVVESGLFGGTRKDGMRFHEGIDLKPLLRDEDGEAADPVFAVLPGVVRYINFIPGNSDYGRYVVIEHTGVAPAVYSLYAHLGAVQDGLRAGDFVGRGQRIGTMGRSSGTMSLPKAQAHLHFELGVRMSDNFQAWYDARGLGGKNYHGLFNGYNLMGFDPLDFFAKWRAGAVGDFQAYFAQMQQAVRVRVVTGAVPDFVRRHPSLLTRPLPAGGGAGGGGGAGDGGGGGGALGGWEIACNPTGLPFAWTPLTVAEVAGEKAGGVRVVAYDEGIIRAWRSRSIVIFNRGVAKPGRDLLEVIEMVFK